MIKRICAAALLSAAGQLVFATPIHDPDNGPYYERIDVPGASGDAAPGARPGVGRSASVDPDGLKVIYSTLDDDRDNAYNCCFGWSLLNGLSGQQLMAMPFTPTEDGHVRRVDLAITWISGANRVSISLRADA